ncbi:hypothetical protein CMUS01_01137 [Colletotrichum musicola]|uniref:Uncharacterized protein n=1 Tax=Colletotrichum musicola TaxID=2175873 RepID=A0A8H6U8B7_9PEZI|nr:hypothetical protein CMUS01_01137 [Colletotrichum musicola]
MGLDGFISAAEQLTGKKGTKKDQTQTQDGSSAQTTNNTDWADAGTAVKAAYENFQADKAQGKGPDYAEIGGAAKKALSACNRQGCGEGKDEGELGREVVAGLCGGQQAKGAEDEEGVEGCKVKAGGEGGRGTRSGLRSEKSGGLGEADLAGGEKYGAGVSQGSGLEGSLGETAADEDGSATLGRGYDETDVTGEKTGSDLADAAQRAGVSRDEAEAVGSFVETGRRNLTSRRGE